MRGRRCRARPRKGTASCGSRTSAAVRRRTVDGNVDENVAKGDSAWFRYAGNQPRKNTCARCGKTAQRLVAHGLRADRHLLVDAIERAYNASVCRPGVPTIRAAGAMRDGARWAQRGSGNMSGNSRQVVGSRAFAGGSDGINRSAGGFGTGHERLVDEAQLLGVAAAVRVVLS